MNRDRIWSISKKIMKQKKDVRISYQPNFDTFQLSVITDVCKSIDLRIRKTKDIHLVTHETMEYYDYITFSWLPVKSEQFIIDMLGGLEQ